MSAISSAQGVSLQAQAFLDMLAMAEGTSTIRASNDGYNVLVGGGLFSSYADHPRKRVWLKSLKLWSTAAGRYQILTRIYDYYKPKLGLHDFSPLAQDHIALQLIREQHAMDAIEDGRINQAIYQCRKIWASLPGAGYGQHEQKLAFLRMAFESHGGQIG